MTYTLPQLGYSYDFLEPYIDTETMQIHHTKHHQAYVNQLNAALEKHPELPYATLEALLLNLDNLLVEYPLKFLAACDSLEAMLFLGVDGGNSRGAIYTFDSTAFFFNFFFFFFFLFVFKKP